MAVGSSSGRGHRGSQDSYEWEQYGLDPSVSPGLARPVGWRVGLPDGTAAWDKTGPLDTDWTPITAASLVGVTQVVAGTGIAVSPPGGTGVVTVSATTAGVTGITAGTNVTISPPGGTGNVTINATVPAPPVSSVVAGDAGITATTAGGVVTVGQTIAAEWDVTRCRVYALDGTNGNDANAGFADPTATGAAAYAVACAAAGAIAKKTWGGLAAIMPRVGRGRMCEIVVAAATYTESPEIVLNGLVGYLSGCPTVRGTRTDATAGVVQFDGSTGDATVAGHVVVPSLNAGGYNAIGSPSTSVIQCQLNGGGAAGFGASPALPVGVRIRFSSTTPTVALRNQCRQVCHVAGTDTVSLQTALSAVPATGGSPDVFYFEQPGVVVPTAVLSAPPGGLNSIQLVGIRWTGNLQIFDSRFRLASCFADNTLFANSTNTGAIATAQTYTHPVLGLLTVGGGLRCTDATVQGIQAAFAGLVCAGVAGVCTMARALSVNWGNGCVARRMVLIDLWSNQDTDSSQASTIGGTSSTIAAAVPRIVGGGVPLTVSGVAARFGVLNIENAGANPCIKFTGKSSIVITGVISGTTGNTDVGMDFQNAILTTVEFRASLLPTVAGSAGEIRLSSQALALYSNTSFEELWDQGANRIFQGNVNGATYRATMNPSVYAGVVNNGAQIPGYRLVAIQAAAGQVRVATADTIPNAIGLVGAMLATAANGAQCLYGGAGGYKVVEFDGAAAVTPGAVAYLSDSLAVPGTATCTVPVVSVTKAKLRLGVVVDNSLPFNLAIIRMTPDNYPVLADGLP